MNLPFPKSVWAGISMGLTIGLVLTSGYIYTANSKTKEMKETAQTQVPRVDMETNKQYQKREVRNTILKKFRDVQDCYNQFLEGKPKVTDGTLALDWNILADGSVDSPSVISSGFGEKKFESCVTGQIAKWQFPTPPSPKHYVEHRFQFKKDPKVEPAPKAQNAKG